jgi:hypothetical protein
MKVGFAGVIVSTVILLEETRFADGEMKIGTAPSNLSVDKIESASTMVYNSESLF